MFLGAGYWLLVTGYWFTFACGSGELAFGSVLVTGLPRLRLGELAHLSLCSVLVYLAFGSVSSPTYRCARFWFTFACGSGELAFGSVLVAGFWFLVAGCWLSLVLIKRSVKFEKKCRFCNTLKLRKFINHN
jgi:uncharacterized membrane protein YccF (DUF307 family)